MELDPGDRNEECNNTYNQSNELKALFEREQGFGKKKEKNEQWINYPAKLSSFLQNY